MSSLPAGPEPRADAGGPGRATVARHLVVPDLPTGTARRRRWPMTTPKQQGTGLRASRSPSAGGEGRGSGVLGAAPLVRSAQADAAGRAGPVGQAPSAASPVAQDGPSSTRPAAQRGMFGDGLSVGPEGVPAGIRTRSAGDELGFQVRFWAEAGPSPRTSPGLQHNSHAVVSDSNVSPDATVGGAQLPLMGGSPCRRGRWVSGKCPHGRARLIKVPCKKRDCEVCGEVLRQEKAERIAYGVDSIMSEGGRVAILVLTFREDVTKVEGVRRLGRFITQLRKVNPGMEYVATFELTKRGRLHINLVIGPWKYIPSAKLRALWGARLSVEYVREGSLVAKEAAKSLQGYVTKLEQLVPQEWGRSISFSRGWPKPPEKEPDPDEPDITWSRLSDAMGECLDVSFQRGYLLSVRDGVYAWAKEPQTLAMCSCFEKLDGAQLRFPKPGGGGDDELDIEGYEEKQLRSFRPFRMVTRHRDARRLPIAHRARMLARANFGVYTR